MKKYFEGFFVESDIWKKAVENFTDASLTLSLKSQYNNSEIDITLSKSFIGLKMKTIRAQLADPDHSRLTSALVAKSHIHQGCQALLRIG